MSASAAAAARPTPPPAPVVPSWGPYGRISLPIFIVLVVLAFSLFCLAVFYLVRYLLRRWGCISHPRPPPIMEVPTSPSASTGLDPVLIAAFPTIPYTSASFPATFPYTLPGRNGRECAVCLGDFSKGDVLRLITGCHHVFHQDCIDLWLEHHTTCPVCRLQLDPNFKPPPEEASTEAEGDSSEEGSSVHIVLEIGGRPSVDRWSRPEGSTERRSADGDPARV